MKTKTITDTLILTILLALLVSCTNSVEDGSFRIPEELRADLWATPSNNWEDDSDPVDDYFEFYASPPEIHDIISINISHDTNGIILTLIIEFNEIVIPATWSGAPEQLFGYVEIDSDQDPSTGEVSLIDNEITFNFVDSPLTNMGVDYIISLHDYDSFFKSAMIFKMDPVLMWDPVGYAHVLFEENTCVLEIPLVAIGEDDGNIDFGLYLGTQPGPTDITKRFSHSM